MKTLERQLADYGEFQTDLHGPISPDELTAQLRGPEGLREPGRRRLRRAFVMVAAAMVVAVLIGGVAWLVAGSTQGDVIHLPTVTTGPSVTSVATTIPESASSAGWIQVPLDETTFGPTSRLRAVAASDSLVVVGGSVDDSAAIWTSTDRLTWTRVPHDEAVFGGSGVQVIRSLVPWKTGFVAAGEVMGVGDFDPARVAIVWYSDDGVSWQRVPHDEAVFGGEGRQEVFSMAATASGLIIVGFDEAGPSSGSGDGTVAWTSTDGVTWRKSLQPGLGEVFAVSGAPEGFIAVGHRSDAARAWKVSADGGMWESLADLGGGVPLDVAVAPSGYVVVGEAIIDGDFVPATWTSPDGTSWDRTEVEIPAEFDVPLLGSVAASDSGFAVAGVGGDSGGGSAILVSSKGSTWELASTSPSLNQSHLESITGVADHFVVVGNAWQGDPIIWTTGG